MILRAVLYGPLLVTAFVVLWVTCRLIDRTADVVDARRRLRRLGGGASVVRLPLPSPDRRGESVPRLAAVPTHRMRR